MAPACRKMVKRKTPPETGGVLNSFVSPKRQKILEADGLTSDATDVGAVDAEVVQFAVGHAIEFCDRLTILAPRVKAASDVHRRPLSWVMLLPAAVAALTSNLMSRLYGALRKVTAPMQHDTYAQDAGHIENYASNSTNCFSRLQLVAVPT